MSNPEKAPQYSAGDQHGSGLLPTANPTQNQPQDSSLPPAYEQGSAELPGDEKPRAPQNPDQHVQFAGSQSQQPPQFAPTAGAEQYPSAADEKRKLEQQYFPPPPPGPPPAQDQHQASAAHPNPLQGNPVTVPQQHQETHQPFETQQSQQAQQNYAIPQYDPAHPTFAPPPTNQPAQAQAPPQPSPTAPTHGHGFGHGPETTATQASTSAHPETHRSLVGAKSSASLVSRPLHLLTAWRTSLVARVSSPKLSTRSVTRQLLS